MPRFQYKAVTESSEIVQGIMDAPNSAAVVDRLRGLGQLPLNAEEVRRGSATRSANPGLFVRRRVSSREILLFTHELGTLLRSGVPLDRAFEVLMDLTDSNEMRGLFGQILRAVRSGASLADALREHEDYFPLYYSSMVRAGEASGALDVVLERLAGFMGKAQKLRESVKTALYYPTFLLIVAVASIVILLTFVIPQFQPLFETAGTALPYSTRVLIGIGSTARSYGWLIAIGAVLVAFIVRRSLATTRGKRLQDGFLLRLPLIGNLITKIEVARFGRTASTLVQNGVALLNTLGIVREVLRNSLMADSVDTLISGLKEGRGLAEPLGETKLFPRLAVHLVRIGEESGQLPEMLSKLADIYEDEVSSTTERLLSLLVPLLTIGMGVMVAAIIGSILTAILSVNSLAF